MSGGRLEGLQVLVTGIEPLCSRDVVRDLLAERAQVTAAHGEDQVLRRLQRDLGLFRTTVGVASVDLFSPSEVRLFEDNLRGQGGLPHMIVCCCEGAECPAALAASLLQPSLVLHATPATGTRLERALFALRTASLPALIQQVRRNGDFDLHTRPKLVSIAGHVFSLHRGEAPQAVPARRREPSIAEGAGRAVRRPARRRPLPGQFAATSDVAVWRRDLRDSK